MKKFKFLAAILAGIALIFACNKDSLTVMKSSDVNDKVNSLRDTPNFEDYEDSLNISHVTNVDFVDYPDINAVWFDHDDGFIDATEWARIKDTVSDMVGSGSPQFIDISIKDDSIYIVTDLSGSSPSFPDDLHPDGGHEAGVGRIAGTWCNNFPDLNGGGCGRTVQGFFAGKAPLAATDRFSQIRDLVIIGSCIESTQDFFSTIGVILRYDKDLWHDYTCATDHPECLDGADMDDFVDEYEALESSLLPSNFKVIALERASKDPDGTNNRWYVNFKVATEVED